MSRSLFIFAVATAYLAVQCGYCARIFGGEPAERDEFPSLLTLQLNSAHICGALILNDRYALTAAQCLDGRKPRDLIVRSGSVDVNGGEFHNVINTVMHENYDQFNAVIHDIAIFEVEPAFTFGSGVQPVVLPGQDDAPAVDASATVVGWGEINAGLPMNDLLYKAVIQISDQDYCEGVYEELGFTLYSPGQICANRPGEYVGSCNGDIGGPIFVDGVVVGLVSWSNGCANPGYPTVHTRVSHYRDWIYELTGV